MRRCNDWHITPPNDCVAAMSLAFVSLRAGHEPSEAVRAALIAHVCHVIGPIATPSEIEFRDRLLTTRSGKIMRRLLKAEELGVDPGNLTTLEEWRTNGDLTSRPVIQAPSTDSASSWRLHRPRCRQ